MVVQEDATRCDATRCRNHRHLMAARDDMRCADYSTVIDLARKTHFVPTGFLDLCAHERSSIRRNGELHTHVFSVFFFAAGNRTLFRMSRYPGECGCRLRSV